MSSKCKGCDVTLLSVARVLAMSTGHTGHQTFIVTWHPGHCTLGTCQHNISSVSFSKWEQFDQNTACMLLTTDTFFHFLNLPLILNVHCKGTRKWGKFILFKDFIQEYFIRLSQGKYNKVVQNTLQVQYHSFQVKLSMAKFKVLGLKF